MNTLQTSLQDLQKKIAKLNERKSDAIKKKTDLEKEIDELYARPLNDRQIADMLIGAVDLRTDHYLDKVVQTGYLERNRFIGNPNYKKHVCLEDVELMHGRDRVNGSNKSHGGGDLLFNLQLIRTDDIGTHTWMSFLLGDVIKKRILEIYRKKCGDKAFEALESLQDRKKSINLLHEKVLGLDSQISAIDSEIDAASKPIKDFMAAV